MQWHKIASLWQFKLDAKRGPLKTGDFGEIRGFGENRQRTGNNGDKHPDPLAKIARGLAISRMWQIFKLDAKSGPFKLDN